ncbi:MAG: hypothetical protein AB7P04_13280 [Bacteriovoracia bacterium]
MPPPTDQENIEHHRNWIRQIDGELADLYEEDAWLRDALKKAYDDYNKCVAKWREQNPGTTCFNPPCDSEKEDIEFLKRMLASNAHEEALLLERRAQHQAELDALLTGCPIVPEN